MYIGASKPHSAQVVEQTFLLCKPDAQKYHRQIVQIVSDAGFLVLAKSFLLTPPLAESIAGIFPSVRRSLCAERGVDKLFKAGGAGDQTSPPSRRAARDLPMDGGAESDTGGGEAIVKRHRNKNEAHQDIMADILRLTRRHGEADDSVNAGLPGADGDENAEPRGLESADRRVASAAVLKNTLLEAMSYQDILREHVQHLAFGGTCLALQLSRQNAVERLLEIVGPENPIDARRAAPTSIRARFGSDLIRNAVHAASNLAEASHCISAVFGFTTQYSAADIRTNAAVSESTGAKGDERGAGGPRAVRPCSELVLVPLHSDHCVPLTPANFCLANVNAQAHLSYYTDAPSPSTTAAEGEKANVNHPSAGEANDDSAPCDTQSWKLHAEDLERELAAERLALTAQAKLLRVRELDLLLREHELEGQTRGFLPAPQPVAFLPPLSQGAAASPSPAPPSGGPIVLAAEDVTALLAKPVRLKALFVAMQQRAADGDIRHEDIIALYDRSPAVQLMGLENHRDRFQKYLSDHIEERVSFDSFVATLMFLFKQ